MTDDEIEVLLLGCAITMLLESGFPVQKNKAILQKSAHLMGEIAVQTLANDPKSLQKVEAINKYIANAEKELIPEMEG